MAERGDTVWIVWSGPDYAGAFTTEEAAERKAEAERQWLRDHDMERFLYQIDVRKETLG